MKIDLFGGVDHVSVPGPRIEAGIADLERYITILKKELALRQNPETQYWGFLISGGGWVAFPTIQEAMVEYAKYYPMDADNAGYRVIHVYF